LVAALGGLLFGYDWVVIGGAKPFFEPFFGIHGSSRALWDSFLSGWANSCALVGCLFGAMGAGALSDRFGRKWLLTISAMIFVVTSIGNALAPNFICFVLWRIMGGTAIGLASNLSPVYISEVAPAGLRGRLVSINQLTIVSGVLLAQITNWLLGRGLPEAATAQLIHDSWYGTTCWRWMFGLTAVPSAFFFLGMFFVPESPRWLVKKRRRDIAHDILCRIGGDSYATAAVAEIEGTLANETERVDFRELFDPRLKKVLMLGVVLAVFQQWCGINVIFNYAEEIFKNAGYGVSGALANIVATGAVSMMFTIAALGVVDRGGRRPLMLSGAAGLAIIYVVLGIGYAVGMRGWPMLALVLAAIGCYSMSLAPITWVILSEIFPNRIRGAAMAVSVSSLWIACFILTITFPTLQKLLGTVGVFGLGDLGRSVDEAHKLLGMAGAFWLYAAICVAGFFYILRRLPETKGKTLEEIEKELVD
ncbi:MAG: sugar porter family MFS transporter, partial [Thermoguttaceae bacterium]